jgi:hypothetical protein
VIDREFKVLGRQTRDRVSFPVEDLNVKDDEIHFDVLAKPLVHGPTRFVRSLCHRKRQGESEHRPDEARIHVGPQDVPRSYARGGFLRDRFDPEGAAMSPQRGGRSFVPRFVVGEWHLLTLTAIRSILSLRR